MSAAVRVRARSPYCVETSAPLVAASPRARSGDERCFCCRPVDGERPADRERVDPRLLHAVQQRGIARVEPLRREPDPFGHCERSEARERARERAAQRRDPDPRDVAFEQRVGGLGRRVRDECDGLRIDRILAQQALEAGDDSGRDAVRMRVRRRHFHRGQQRAGFGVDRDHVGERSPDVDADAHPGHARLSRSPAVSTRVAARDDRLHQ